MSKDTAVVEIPADLRPVLESTAKNLLHHLYGSAGLPWGTSLADLEDLTVEITRTLGTQMIQQALQRQAQQPLPDSAHLCPVCSAPLSEKPHKSRTLQSCLGTSDWQEPARHCDRCRRAFFPSVQESWH